MITATDAASGKITASTNISITVNAPPSFSLSAQSPAVSVAQGGKNSDGITVARPMGLPAACLFLLLDCRVA